jgi:hypothetical protein
MPQQQERVAAGEKDPVGVAESLRDLARSDISEVERRDLAAEGRELPPIGLDPLLCLGLRSRGSRNEGEAQSGGVATDQLGQRSDAV